MPNLTICVKDLQYQKCKELKIYNLFYFKGQKMRLIRTMQNQLPLDKYSSYTLKNILQKKNFALIVKNYPLSVPLTILFFFVLIHQK